MKIKTVGIQRQQIDVEVCATNVISELFKEELKSINFSNKCNKKYDTKFFIVTNTKGILKLEEHYIKSGIDYGHYNIDDELVGVVDRTEDLEPKYLEYLNALQTVKNFKRGIKEKDIATN